MAFPQLETWAHARGSPGGPPPRSRSHTIAGATSAATRMADRVLPGRCISPPCSAFNGIVALTDRGIDPEVPEPTSCRTSPCAEFGALEQGFLPSCEFTLSIKIVRYVPGRDRALLRPSGAPSRARGAAPMGHCPATCERSSVGRVAAAFGALA